MIREEAVSHSGIDVCVLQNRQQHEQSLAVAGQL